MFVIVVDRAPCKLYC